MESKSYKQIAQHFLRLASKGEPRKAFSLYVGQGFKHHNIYFKGDAESLMLAMEENAKKAPDKVFEIKHAVEDGDLAVVHSHVRQNLQDLGAAVIHIFALNLAK
jgi:predicted SnoaL-like aldol condensation-catalyzing enzyme